MLTNIYAENPDEALVSALIALQKNHIVSDSRNGKVLRFPGPVTTQFGYSRGELALPVKRVSLNPVRNANPFFHLLEAMWMLAGRNDIAFVAFFNKQMAAYSDDSTTQAAAYGRRWNGHFGMDQIAFVINELKRAPNSRRAVINMWDPCTDIDAVQNNGADVPCNTAVYFLNRGDGVLDMTVTNRSNDIVWGAYGANVVHFSFLHEYVAGMVGMKVGAYYQISNDLHLYTDTFSETWMADVIAADVIAAPTQRYVPGTGLFCGDQLSEQVDPADWFMDMQVFFAAADQVVKAPSKLDIFSSTRFRTPWWRHTVQPLFEAWVVFKRHGGASAALERMAATPHVSPDWLAACVAWMERKV